MGYIDTTLMPGETVTYRTRLHWIIFSRPLIFAVLGFSDILKDWGCLRQIAIVLAVLMGIHAIISFIVSEFGVTDKRVIVKTGFIRRQSLEILLSQVEAIGVHQGIVARLLDYGSVVIGGTGGTRGSYGNIAAPLAFRRHVQRQIEERRVEGK